MCKKNEQQQNTKNNIKFQYECTNMSWKIFEETIRRGRNRTAKVYLVTEDDDDDDDDEDHISQVNFICEFYLTVTKKTNLTNLLIIL